MREGQRERWGEREKEGQREREREGEREGERERKWPSGLIESDESSAPMPALMAAGSPRSPEEEDLTFDPWVEFLPPDHPCRASLSVATVIEWAASTAEAPDQGAEQTPLVMLTSNVCVCVCLCVCVCVCVCSP